MITIKIQDKKTINKQELLDLSLYQLRNELGRELTDEDRDKCERHTNWLINKFITKNFLAYDDDDELIGWLGVQEVVPPTLLLFENHPIIKTNNNKKSIAKELLVKCFEYTKKNKIANTRVFVDVPERKKKRYAELEDWYIFAGMKQLHTVLCMENKITDKTLQGVVVNNEYHVDSAETQDFESLEKCYNLIFSQALDNFTNSLDKEERKYWNAINRGKYNEASKVIKKNDEIVAMILAINYGDFIELGSIGVIPEHRGKGLGKVLMEESLKSLLEQNLTESYLEVDITNKPAINLYQKYGFKEVSKKHGFRYRIDDEE